MISYKEHANLENMAVIDCKKIDEKVGIKSEQ